MLLRTRYRLVTLLCAGALLCGGMYAFNMIAYVDELCKQRLMAVQSESKNEVSEAARKIVSLERDLHAAQGRVAEMEEKAPPTPTTDRVEAVTAATVKQPDLPAPFGIKPARLQHDLPPPASPALLTPATPPPTIVAAVVPTASQNSMATAGIVIITCCRADYLERTLQGVFDNMDGHSPAVYVSQDKQEADVTKVIQKWVSSHGVVWLRHPPADLSDVPPNQGRTYHLIARHVGWAIGQLFDVHHHTKAIIIEDDIQIAPDFFSFMGSTAPLLYEDPSLFCVSAWNDNGQKGRVYDSEALYRSDFFPGLGWLLTADLWAEIGPKWPKGYWDDWLREPENRRARACIRPEVSRTFTFGEEGSSNGQFYREFLSSIYLNDAEHKVDWAHKDLSYLLKRNYDPAFTAKIAQATSSTIGEFLALPAVSSLCPVGTACDDTTRALKVEYGPGVRGEYPRLARQLNIMTDEKAGVWRTAYGGVVTLRREGVTLYLVPRGFDGIH